MKAIHSDEIIKEKKPKKKESMGITIRAISEKSSSISSGTNIDRSDESAVIKSQQSLEFKKV